MTDAEREAITSAFRSVLAQYNINLGTSIDLSQKSIALLLTVATIYFGLHNNCSTPNIWAIFTIIGVALIMLAFFLWMQWKYFQRCRNSLEFLNAHAKTAHPYGLSTLGILSGEHRRIIAMWSCAFVIIAIAVLTLVARCI